MNGFTLHTRYRCIDMAVKLKELMAMTARELSRIPHSELRETYQNIRKIVNSRVQTFGKHGISDVVPEKLRSGLSSARGRSDQELLQQIRESTAWMRGRRSTYKGYAESREDFRKKMQESLPDLDLSDDEKMDDFGYFMGEMQDRYGEMWDKISAQVKEMYKNLTALNEDPRQFMKNYDYWSARVEAVNEAKRMARAPGRRRSTELSTYMRQLKRGKIK